MQNVVRLKRIALDKYANLKIESRRRTIESPTFFCAESVVHSREYRGKGPFDSRMSHDC
jgi:hypothetical protein